MQIFQISEMKYEYTVPQLPHYQITYTEIVQILYMIPLYIIYNTSLDLIVVKVFH